MKNIEETIDFLNGKEINIKHPYADFTFIFNKHVMCGGTLYLSAWGLKGKVSFDGDKWFDVDSLKPNEEFYVEYFYETIVNDFGWVYQDIYATLDVIMLGSILRKFKIISISNKPKPTDLELDCDMVEQMDRKLLFIIDEARRKLSEKYNIKGLSISGEHIIIVDLIDNTLPSIDLLEEEIPSEYSEKLFDIEKGINYILNNMGIDRFCVGKIHKQ